MKLNKKREKYWQKEDVWETYMVIALDIFINSIKDKNIKIASKYAMFQTLRQEVM